MSATGTSRPPLRPGYLQSIEGQFEGEPDEPVLLFEGNWVSYGDLGATINAVRDAVVERSSTGAPIGIEAPNAPYSLAGIIGVMLSGRCAIPLSPRRFDDDIERLEDELGAILFRLAGEESRDLGRHFEDVDTPLGVLTLAIVDKDLDGDPDVALMLGTSGTTGEPRRVPILHRTIDMGIQALRVSNGRSDRKRDVNVVCFPMYHLAGLIPSLLTLATGRQIALLEKFDAHKVADLVEDHAIRSLALTPTTVRDLVDAGIPRERLGSLRYVRSGTAPLPIHLARRFQDTYGVPLIQAYGQTEAGGEVIGWDPADMQDHLVDKIGAVGRPRPGIEVLIADPSDELPNGGVPAGEIGELWLRGVQGDDEWHRSGDLASRDDDGFIWIHGRADDVIICGGFNIHPAMLEHVLEQHPNVHEAAVTGVPDDRLGSIPVAAVVAAEGITDGMLDTWCRDHLEPYQRPRRYLRVDAVPRTDTGKVQRQRLQELATTP